MLVRMAFPAVRYAVLWGALVGVGSTADTARAVDPLGLDDTVPTIELDVPGRLLAREIATPESVDQIRQGKLVRVTVPLSLRLVKGDVGRVKEVVIEIDGTAGGLAVVDFAPRTTLLSEEAAPIEVTTTKERSRSIEASLGGQLPMAAGTAVAQVAPSISAGDKRRDAETITTRRLPPKRPLAVSGTLSQGHGAFFQLRPSSQSTLEGQHLVSATFHVPADWSGDGIEVRCRARGTKKVFWSEQATTWASLKTPLQVTVLAPHPAAPHLVAKPAVDEPAVKEPLAVESASPAVATTAAANSPEGAEQLSTPAPQTTAPHQGEWVARGSTALAAENSSATPAGE